MNQNKIKNILRVLIKKIIKIVFPPRCPFCMRIVTRDDEVACAKCTEHLPYITGTRCMKCGKQLEDEEKEYCMDCGKKEHYYTQGIALWSYHKTVKQSIYRFKYKNKRNYADFFAHEIVKRYGDIIRMWDADGLIPVPMYKSKKRKRGYNQAEVLACSLSNQLHIPVYNKTLIRTRNTLPQKNLNDKERQENLKNAFKIIENSVKLRRVIIVDDIYTTGSTVDAMAHQLAANGTEVIYVIALCIGKGY